MTRWSNGMTLAPRAGDPGFKSGASPMTEIIKLNELKIVQSFGILVFKNFFLLICIEYVTQSL